jgi:hypothetical protein
MMVSLAQGGAGLGAMWGEENAQALLMEADPIRRAEAPGRRRIPRVLSRAKGRQRQFRKELTMVVIRNVFRLKFGKAREAIALFKEGIAIQKRAGAGLDFSTRLLTDVTGPFYTVVLEITAPNLAAFEAEAPRLMGDKDWQANYQKIAPLVESGSRDIFTLVD